MPSKPHPQSQHQSRPAEPTQPNLPPQPFGEPLIQPPGRQPTAEEIRRVIEEAGGETSRVVGEILETDEEIAQAEADETTTLEEQELQWFRALVTVGRRHKTINVMDHTVQIQTLTIADELRIGLFCKDYANSQADYRAYQVAVCAAGIRTVDGQPLYQSLLEKPDEDAVFAEKVEKLKQFYPVVISRIYMEIVELDKEFASLADKLGKH